MSGRRSWSALLLVVACLLAFDTSSAGAAARDPMYGAPDADACYDVPISAADAWALHDPAVPCSSRHTLWIVGVVQAPRSVAFDGSMRFWRFAGRACGHAQDTAIGDQIHRYLRTTYQNFFFLPTKAQQTRGAHWISCELGWLVGDERLVHHRLPSAPRLSAHMSGDLELCLNRHRVQCARPHQWRAVYGQPVRGAYSPEALRRVAHRVCPGRTSTPRWRFTGGAPVGIDSYSLTCYERSTR